jgi:hypothetical protein
MLGTRKKGQAQTAIFLDTFKKITTARGEL